MFKNIRMATSYILVATTFGSSLAWQSSAYAQNNDLFPNIKDTPRVTETGNNNGPVTIDETDSSEPLPFTPVAPYSPVGPNPFDMLMQQ